LTQGDFRLQHVGDLRWLKEHYDFRAIARSIDELVVLDVARNDKSNPAFTDALSELIKECFMPVAAGGGINTMDKAYEMFDAGADKIVLNTALVKNPDLIKALNKTFGEQSIVASIDYKSHNGSHSVFIENGSVETGWSINQAIRNAIDLGVGEVYLTSIERDGTGRGYDVETLQRAVSICPVPIIASGGVGRYGHLVEGINQAGVEAVSTANLFAFMADGLTEARDCMKNSGIDLASWDLDF
ncbi:MAG: HisA/HisF-related TIM barrel protein, partial [Methanosarcinaceae archaeon]|nr:HisA/HisF-related TIM barrel protein [Methanosarcinaceae archaeon]